MKISHYLIAGLAFTQASCTTVSDPREPNSKYRVRYSDTNKDGYIDEAFFTPGGYDGDFVVKDTNFDGRYDSATIFGVGIFTKAVDYPVYLDEEQRRLNKDFLTPYTYE